MAIIPWESFGDMDNFFSKDWDLFPVIPMRGLKVPEVDVYQTNKDVVVEMPLVGVKPEDVDISVENNVLIAKGKTEETKEEKKRDYYKKEIKKGEFSRSVVLPAEVKTGKAKAEAKNGILKITLPKAEVKKSRKIQVKVKK